MAAAHGFPARGAPRLSDYDYVRFLSRSRLAWEYIRRNPVYRRDWREHARQQPRPVHLADGTVVLRTRQRIARAEAWGLYTFRQSRPYRP